MSKGLKTFMKLAVAAAGVYAVGKYLHDYTDYKPAAKDDLNELKNGGERAKEAAKRTYIAIKNGDNVNVPAGELGTAVADIAGGAGKIVSAVGENTKQFALNEKEKYMEDPEGYRAKVAENLKDMGQQATGLFNEIKENAEGFISDIKDSAGSLRFDEDDFVNAEAEPKPKADVAAGNGFLEISEEPLYTVEPEKQYADITPAEAKAEEKVNKETENKKESDPEEVIETVKEKENAKTAENGEKENIVVSDDPEEIKQ